MTMLIIVGVLIGLAILAIFVGVARTLAPSTANRLDDFLTDRPWQSPAARRNVNLASSTSSIVQTMERGIRTLSVGDRLAGELARADLHTTVTEFLLLWLLSIAGLGVLGFLLSRLWLFGVLGGIIGALIPYFILRSRQASRLRAFQGQLQNVLMQLASSVRAGYSIQQAIDFVAHEMPAPAGKEFSQVVRDVKLGRALMDALDDLLVRIQSEDLQMIITAIHIQHETGGNLAEILETISETIRERMRIQGQLRALTGTQRLASYVLGGLPVIVFLVLMLLNPSYEANLFNPGPTLCIPVCAAISMVSGYLAIRQIVSLEV